MSDNIEHGVRKMIAHQCWVQIEDVQPETHIFDDLGADSLDLVELVMDFEDEFEVEINDDDGESITTVQSAIDLVKRLRAQ